MTSWPGLAVGAEKFVGVIQLVDIFPAAAGKRLEVGRPADVGENRRPIERIREVTEGAVIRVRRQGVGGKQDRLRNGDADFGRERVVKKFFVGAPPKGIVHDGAAGERFVLEPATVKGDVLRNAIDHDIVTDRFALDHLVDAHWLGLDLAASGLGVDTLDEGGRETVFLAEENSDFFHRRFNRGLRG